MKSMRQPPRRDSFESLSARIAIRSVREVRPMEPAFFVLANIRTTASRSEASWASRSKRGRMAERHGLSQQSYGVEISGRHSFHEDVVEALGTDFDDVMKAAGFRDLDGQPLHLPPDLQRHEPPQRQLSADATVTVFGITAFVLGSLANAIIKNFLDEVWKQRVHPALVRLLAKEEHGQRAVRLPFHHTARLWFDTDRVMVSVIALIERPDDLAIAEDLIPVAFDKAAHWLERHGRTHTYITYRIEHGDLSAIPTLSEEQIKA